MGRPDLDAEAVNKTVLHQLKLYWPEINEKVITDSIPAALKEIENGFFGLPNKRFFKDGKVQFSPLISTHWMIFLYRLSHEIFVQSGGTAPEADQVYYLNKVLHALDWFYAIDLPVHFLCEHPLGSVLGRANYGDHFVVYQGTTVGGNRSHGKLQYPVIGDNVILYANSTVLGDTHIGNNVVVSAGTYLINEEIPDNCIVFGKSPDIIIKTKSESVIKDYSQHIWGWK